jgi:hypothetical protein
MWVKFLTTIRRQNLVYCAGNIALVYMFRHGMGDRELANQVMQINYNAMGQLALIYICIYIYSIYVYNIYVI